VEQLKRRAAGEKSRNPLEIAARKARMAEKAETGAALAIESTMDEDDDDDEGGEGDAMADNGIAEVMGDAEDDEEDAAGDDDGDVEAKAGDVFMCVARTEDE